MSKNITQRLAGVAAAVASLAMLFCALPAQAVDYSTVGSDAAAKANVVQALEYVQDLNALRASTKRRPLTAQQIIDAINADEHANYPSSYIDPKAADGSAVVALKVNDQLMSWAQTRANELAKRAESVSDTESPLDGHANTANGRPDWAINTLTNAPGVQPGTFTFGPEALAIGYPDYDSNMAPVAAWYSELNAENNLEELRKQYPGWTDADILSQERQGYGHYLTEVNPYANIAGFGVAKVSSGRWKGALVSVLEVGNSWNAKGTTQSVQEALAGLRSIQSVANPAAQTVESSTGTPAGLPTTVGVKYDDGTTGSAAVTWNVPNDWNKNRDQHTVTLTGTVAGTTLKASLNLTVKAATVTSATANGSTAVTTPSGTNPERKLPKTATVAWSNGSEDKNVAIKWASNDTYKQRAPRPYTLTGTIGSTGKTVTATITVEPATVSTIDQPAKASISKGTKPTIPTTVKAHWSNGDTTDATIYWDNGKNPADASFGAVGKQTFAGTAEGKPVTWEVEVVAAKVEKAYDPAPMTTEAGVDPTDKLPSTVQADLDNGQKKQNVSVAWDALPDTWKNYQGGTITLKGTVNGQADKRVTLTIAVKHATIEPQTLTGVSVPAGVNPTNKLPKTVTITWSNNTGTKGNVAVQWSKIADSAYAEVGAFNATGTVNVDGQTGTVTVPVTVTDPVAVKAAPTKTEIETIATHAPDLSGVKATVTYSNGSTKIVDVDWPADIDVSKAATVPVTGMVQGVSIDGKAATVTLNVTVKPRAITAVTPLTDAISIPTAKDTDSTPSVTGKVTVTWNDGATEARDVALTLPDGWNHDIAEHTVTATGRTEGWAKDIPFSVTVEAATAETAENPADLSTPVKLVPTLPTTVKVTWSNGQTTNEQVSWTKPDDSVYGQVTAENAPIVVNGTVKGMPVSVRVYVVAATLTGVDAPEGVSTEAGTAAALPSTATAHWSNGSTSQVAVTWKTDGVDFSNRSGADKTVKVKGAVQGWNDGVETTVTVHSAVVTNAVVDGKTTVTTDSGKDPSAQFPKNAKLTWSDDGADSTESIAWEKFTGYTKREGGLFTVNGTVKGKTVTVQVTVNPATPVKVVDDTVIQAIQVGGKLDLPEQLDVVWSNGDKVATVVTWDSYDAKLLNKVGSFKIAGKVNPTDDVAYTVVAKVTVSAKQTTVEQDKTNTADKNSNKNKLTNTGSNIAIVAVAVVVLLALAVGMLVISKNKRTLQ
ncbi:Ig-like domain-containing protein [Bifidobacterium cebidarum]|uniref:Bacterial Ig-like domain (Group 4) n=1 Tax=Bifidobacterium cebidarum TaxID=2650773 RepID=A0A6I1GAQ8_9BIFI|nr:Ig-like domain-containing protein [Bifidobacterium cebidarum]KAB7787004.1 Bacterial Ig-like domain (group 4) [Bifidobacterium cebidarum]